MKLKKDDEGGIVLEAAIIMPFFVVFVLALISFIIISMADTALQSSTSQAAEQIAAHMYPVVLIINEVGQSKAGEHLIDFIGQVGRIREKMIGAEQFVDHYAYFIPDFVLESVKREQALRLEIEERGIAEYHRLLNKAFTPILLKYADRNVLKVTDGNPRVVNVLLPDLNSRENAYFGIETEYDIRLPLPFIDKVIRLKKRAYERVWIGA
jgi:hypothetical protein